MSEQLALLPSRLTAHVQLTLLALLFSTAFSLPVGIMITRVRWLQQPVLGIAGVIQTIPSLALLAILVVLLQSFGFLPAIIALTAYGVLPVLVNTVTGITGVDAALKEAARGVGMTPLQQLRRVELPLAMPVIVAGIRTSTVLIVGIATLSTPVGATSLGNYIFEGLQTRNNTAVLVGCVAAALLALSLDGLVRALEANIRNRRRLGVTISLTLLGALYGYTGVTLASGFLWTSVEPITIGSKTFTEQYILSEVIGRQIEGATGYPTEVIQSLGSTVAFDALRSGNIDVYVDYSGTIWATLMRRDTVPADRMEVLREVERFLRDEHDIVLVGALGFENAYALATRDRDAEALGLQRISDLTLQAPRLSIGSDYEFFARPEWAAIQQAYGLHFQTERSMDSSLMYQAVAQGDVDVISAFSTDGRIVAFNLRVLEDDRHAIPPYDAVVLANGRLARARPQVISAIERLAGTIDADRMRRMNLAVDGQDLSPSEVAERFLRELATRGDSTAATVP